MLELFSRGFSDFLLPVILLSSGIFLTVKLNFVQLRFLFSGLKNMLKAEKSTDSGISPFAALATSLAAQLGTGNIVGAGSAIISGGPGAVFWMWVSAFFGMALSYCEAANAVVTRKTNADGSFSGGAAYYIKYAFSGRTGAILSSAFSLFVTIALGFSGVAVQANSISQALFEAFSLPFSVCAVLITAAAATVLLRGTRAVTKFSEKTVPVFTLLYIAGCLAVILLNIKGLPDAIRLIFTSAFSSKALFGGITGIGIKQAISQGIKRGLFTNEAGMGSAPSAHALSSSENPHFQGTLGLAGVFIDTFVMLSVTALAAITVLYTGESPPDSSLSGSQVISLALSSVFTQKGAEIFIALSVLFFAFASILGWHISGKASALFLFGEKCEGLYIISSLFFVFTGSILPVKTVWTVTDIFNTLMVLTNIPALIKLHKKSASFIPVRKHRNRAEALR